MDDEWELLKDQEELRNRNQKYLEIYIKDYFKNAFSNISAKYRRLINSNLIDPNDLKARRQFLENEFWKLNQEQPLFYSGSYSYYESIKVENENFIYSLQELMKSSKNVINEIYPPLEQRNGQSASFQFFMGSIEKSTEKAYLKSLLNFNSSSFNSIIFSNPDVQEFFELFLFKQWLSNIENCKPQLSYIFKRLKRSGGYREKDDPGEIHCKGKQFMKYWNSFYHPFKIIEKKNSNFSLHNSPGYSHKPIFDSLVEEYKQRKM